MAKKKITLDQLQIGLYIQMPVRWRNHPFLFSHFKIKTDAQLTILRRLKLPYVLYLEEKSDTQPLPKPEVPEAEEGDDEDFEANLVEDQLWKEKQERIERLQKHRKEINACEKQYSQSVNAIKSVMKEVQARPLQAAQEANQLVENIADSIMQQSDLILHLMNDKNSEENIYFHSLNVSVLSMLLAKEAGYSAEEVKTVGVAGLFHDIGQIKIPNAILHKDGPLTKPEQHLLELHPRYGVEFAQKIPDLDKDIIAIIAQHHEYLDGSGYPKQLQGDEIHKLARVVAIANSYDNHCNHLKPEKSLPPSVALSYMFKKQNKQLDASLLALFIKHLGIYPPGTVVKLSNDMIGLVISVNTASILHPCVLLYDPNIPKNEASIFDMQDDKDIAIVSSIRPSQLPTEVYEYLSPRTRVSYYFSNPTKPK